MRNAVLTKSLDLGGYGGVELFFGDINQDGEPEIVTYQGPGVFGARMFAGLDRIKPHLPPSQCVTAFDMNGRLLWTWGQPNSPDRPYVAHAYESCVSIGDADNDGKAEVAVALGNAVVLLDGLTGKEKRSASLPEDYFYIVHVLGQSTAGHEAAMVVKNGEDDYTGGPYGQPVIGLNAELEPVWGPVVIPGAGHHVLTMQTRQNGSGEYLIGYCAVKPDGRIDWTVDSIDSGRIDAEKQHVDYSVMWRENDGRLLFAMAGSDRGYVVENGGRTLFTITKGHVQGVAVGKFQGADQIQAVFYNAPKGPIVLYDMHGQCLWQADTPRLDENMHPLSLPQGCSGAFHRNLPILTLPGADHDWIAYADGGWPWGLDGAGKLALTFPPPEPYAQINWSQASLFADKNRMDDMGYGYAIKSVGAFGSSVPLTAIYNRRFVWFYTV